MTREEIEADIMVLTAMRAEARACEWPMRDIDALERAIARLRAELARMDGPADGYKRIRIGVDRDKFGITPFLVGANAEVDEHTIAVVTADIPLPRVVEVEGVVEVTR